MASIRLTQFAGLMPELSAKLKRKDNAQIAHNCLLYDGRLRAMPAYQLYDTAALPPKSWFNIQNTGGGDVFVDYQLEDVVYVPNAPFPSNSVGIAAGVSSNFIGTELNVAPFASPVISAGLTVPTASGLSIDIVGFPSPLPRPAAVSYALTYMRGNQESAPLYLGTIGKGVPTNELWYEGCATSIVVNLNPTGCGITGIRLYRTITAIVSGEQMVSTFDTDWYLVTQVPFFTDGGIFSYTDIALTEQLPGDLLLSETFFPPYSVNQPRFFGLTESGWCWYATKSEIQFSERYMFHAWPQANHNHISNTLSITDATSFYDTVFLGTKTYPYRVNVAIGDDENLQIAPFPYPESQPCIAGTLVTAPFGALYTSPSGVVSLEESKMQVLTRDLLNGGDVLFRECDHDTDTEELFHFADITRAAWFNGWYIGYAPTGKIFVYQAPEDLNDVHAFQQLVTMDAPAEIAPGPSIVGGLGLHISFGTNLYYWPVPGWVRAGDVITKLCYRWKSKKFVMPGVTAFAAAKVVWDCDGEVCFTLYGDCRVVYSRKIKNCQPFRLPPMGRHIEWEIELTGTGTVSEVHVASSMEQLTEVENE